ncbi:alpha/beta hydrolase [Sphingomonas colocasiae]|uniref:Alpha/beta hydrolase n=1 Tax=Sphingomonas colocasiae TaxID=1848973 RepID=A0ABS7PQG0_9SPHN|nr:alpha/beta hydrolase [Sphingomonas colocasiae]MBY8823571.1 alpha/beta hydrolase [Sphingomonas colocasiae]
MSGDPHDWEALRQQRLARLPAETRAALLARAGWPPFEELGVGGFRERMSAYTQAPVESDDIEWRDISVPGTAGVIPMRLFRPRGRERVRGISLYVHGGGFIGGGGLDGYTPACVGMARTIDCIVALPDFRLPPEHKFPAAIDDVWTILQWLSANADAIGGDARRIAIGGGCTGATHAAAAAIMARDAGLPPLRLQWLFDALLDARCDYRSHAENGRGYQLSTADNRYIIRRYLNRAEERWDWRVSPVLAPSLRGVAPALIVAAEFDILRDEMEFYANRLRDAGVAVDHRCYPMEGHSFSFGEDPGKLSPAGIDARTAQADALREALD